MKFINNLVRDRNVVPNEIKNTFQNFLLEEAEKTYSIEFNEEKWLQKPEISLIKDFMPRYGDITELNSNRLILEVVGKKNLQEIAQNLLNLLGTSVAIYEINGDYALGINSSNWCRLLDQSSRDLCSTDNNREALESKNWHCHISASNASKIAIKSGKPVHIECYGKIRIYAVPISVKNKIIGSINVGYGDPPKDLHQIEEVAERYELDKEILLKSSLMYDSRPEYITKIAQQHLMTSANLIGAIVERKLIEDNSRVTETKWRKILEFAPDIIFTVNENGKILFINHPPEGLTAEEAVNTSTYDYVDPEHRKKVKEAIQTTFKTKKPIDFEIKARGPHNRTSWYSTRMSSVINDGKDETIILVTRDITNRKNAEEQLKKRSSELSERIKELDCLYRVSQIIEDLQKPISDVFAEILSTISAAMQWPDIICARIILDDEEFTTDNFEETEWKLQVEIITSGVIEGRIEVFYKQKPSDSELIFLNEEQNLIQGVSRQISDYLLRKRFSEELKHNEERMRSLVENSPDLITIVDKNAIVQFINNNTYDFTIEEMVGERFYKFIQSKYHRKFRKVITSVFKSGRAISIETTEERKDGSIVWYENHIAPILRDNKVVSIMVITRDITNRIMEGKLRVSLEEKDVLLQEIHHRVKNNLQVISSLLNIQSKRLEDKQALEFFKKSQDRVQTMALIHEKLYRSEDIARINFGKYVQDLTTQLSISHGVESKEITWKIDVKNIFFDITLAIPCGLIINELVSNSLKHAFPKDRRGGIYIKMYVQRRNKVLLLFGDDGIGFEEEMDFSQIKTLGLQLVNTLVKQINGSISLNKNKKAEYRIIFNTKKN